MKKILSILMVVALIAAMLSVGVVSTGAAETATITIYGLDGSTKTKEVNVGDEFTVYTTLDVSDSVSNGKVGSVDGTQTYTSSVLSLVDQISGQYGEFVDPETVFPITGTKTMANAATAGYIYYNASLPSAGFKFDTAYSKLIVTTYKVKAAGSAEVKNALTTLAAADPEMTKIIYKGQLQDGKSIDGTASFEDPTPEIDHAHVTIYKLDGTTEEKDFDIGDSFTVYTMLNVSACVGDGKVGSINGVQKYSSDKLELASAVQDGEIANLSETFPTTKENTVTNCKTAGTIKYAASSARGFLFSDDNCQLIKTYYTVTANGFAEIRNSLSVLAAADEDATRIVFGGETQPGKSYSMPASFYPPGEAPTEGPTEKPTQKPTQTPTQAPTESNELVVTIKGPNGSSVTKNVAVGSEFTVYTMLDVTDSVANGNIASIDGYQTFDTAKLQLTDSVEGEENIVVYLTDMFPILSDSAVASVNDGVIRFNASKPGVNNGFKFNSPSSKLIVTNYKALEGGTVTIETKIKDMIASDADATKIVYKGELQTGKSIDLYESFTDPGQPATDAPTDAPTTAPTEAPTAAPTDAPTEAPTAPADKAVITIVGFDGSSEVRTFSIGETFDVYTTLNLSQAIENCKFSAINASQSFPNEILALSDVELDDIGVIENAADMFPVLGANAMARLYEDQGMIRYNASTPQVGKGFAFPDDDTVLIQTTYTVTAPGVGTITNSITTLTGDDADLTRVVSKGVVMEGAVIGGIATYTDPSLPPTEPPTAAPTEAPTEAPPVPATATITIKGLDGKTEVKTVNVGDSFNVYTTLNVSDALADSMISAVNAYQTYSADILACNAEVDADGIVTPASAEAMFPIIGDNVIARVADGSIVYNSSTPNIGNGYKFDNDSCLLIVTTYTVTAAGEGIVENGLTTVVSANADLTRIVDKGDVQGDYEIGGIASFTEPTPEPTEAPTDAPTEAPTSGAERYLLGDANNDGFVDVLDATIIQRYRVGYSINVSVDYLMKAGDVNGDGFVDVTDATLIQRHRAGYEIGYPIGQWIEA